MTSTTTEFTTTELLLNPTNQLLIALTPYQSKNKCWGKRRGLAKSLPNGKIRLNLDYLDEYLWFDDAEAFLKKYIHKAIRADWNVYFARHNETDLNWYEPSLGDWRYETDRVIIPAKQVPDPLK